jgi:hypothetical protein
LSSDECIDNGGAAVWAPIDAPNGARSALFVSSPEAAKQSRERMSHAGDDDAAEQATCRDRAGAIADASVLSDDRGRFILHDNKKTEVVAERLLQPLFCLRAG